MSNKLSTISKDVDSIDIIVSTHGVVEQNNYYLFSDNTLPVTGERFLKYITKNVNKPV